MFLVTVDDEVKLVNGVVHFHLVPLKSLGIRNALIACVAELADFDPHWTRQQETNLGDLRKNPFEFVPPLPETIVLVHLIGAAKALRLSDKPPQRLEPSATASQAAPKRSYVYGHYDAERVNKNETPSVKV